MNQCQLMSTDWSILCSGLALLQALSQCFVEQTHAFFLPHVLKSSADCYK